jgi:hypothetical protein
MNLALAAAAALATLVACGGAAPPPLASEADAPPTFGTWKTLWQLRRDGRRRRISTLLVSETWNLSNLRDWAALRHDWLTHGGQILLGTANGNRKLWIDPSDLGGTLSPTRGE